MLLHNVFSPYRSVYEQRKFCALIFLCFGVLWCGGACSTPASQEDASGGSAESTSVTTTWRDTHVLADSSLTGVDASRYFFDHSETAVVSGVDGDSQLRAASISIVSHSPMMTQTANSSEDIGAELDRLGATKVLLVGVSPQDIQATDSGRTFIVDQGTDAALESLTSLTFDKRDVSDRASMAQAVASMDARHPEILRFVSGDEKSEENSTSGNHEKQPAFPAQTARSDGHDAPVIASPATSVPAVATARAWGAAVTVLPYPDPRFSSETMKSTRSLMTVSTTEAANDVRPLVVLGSDFGSQDYMNGVMHMVETASEWDEGGQILFPSHRMVAYYGHPSTSALGVLGETSAGDAASAVSSLVAHYQGMSDATEPGVHVIPAFEIIATVATGSPGERGTYSADTAPEEIEPWIDAITAAGGYAVLDFQPGREKLIDQVQRYADLIARPNVGVALDPEWRLGPEEFPLEQVGHVDVSEINEVSQWLADYVAAKALPQKILMVHQFQVAMIRHREQLVVDHPELALTIHVDGHGTPQEKYATWSAVREGLDPRVFLAWKNFYDEDSPMLDPEQTYNVEPRPYFVSYQ